MTETDLQRALGWAAARFGRREHVVEGERRFSFVDVDDAATRVAAALRGRGLRPGDRIALRVANAFESIAAIFGVWRAGGVLVPVNPRSTDDEEKLLAGRSGAAFRGAATGSGLAVEPTGTDGRPETGLAAIAFTSGTTGLPKGVEITHGNMLWSASAVVHTRRDRFDAVAAVVSPICHLPVFVSHYLARLLSGGNVVIGSFDAERLVASLADHGVTDLPLVPAMVAPLLERMGTVPDRLRIRKVTVGSATTTMATKELLAERFPGAEILEAYGQTESTDGLTMTTGREALERPGTVGRAHATIPLAVVDGQGERVLPGVAGEVVCQGPTVMRGYHRDVDGTRATIRDGWLHTGDLGRLDEDGFLYLTGRVKEIIITGGENVSPEEVELVLSGHPAVAEVAVFGLPDPRWGETIAAAIVPRGTVTAQALGDFVGQRLAAFKRPRRIFFVDSLPKTSAGKVRRPALREKFAGIG